MYKEYKCVIWFDLWWPWNVKFKVTHVLDLCISKRSRVRAYDTIDRKSIKGVSINVSLDLTLSDIDQIPRTALKIVFSGSIDWCYQVGSKAPGSSCSISLIWGCESYEENYFYSGWIFPIEHLQATESSLKQTESRASGARCTFDLVLDMSRPFWVILCTFWNHLVTWKRRKCLTTH